MIFSHVRFFLIVFSLLSFLETTAQIRLPKIFSYKMVLQRGDSTRLWGWTETSNNITVDFLSRKYVAKPTEGKWEIFLSNLKAGGPHKMTIYNNIDTIVLRNILIGDVWICSGQSNMEMPVNKCRYASAEVENGNDLYIRHFKVPRSSAL